MLESCLGLGLVTAISLLNEHAFDCSSFSDYLATFLAILTSLVLVLTIIYIGNAAHKFYKEVVEDEEGAEDSKYFKMFDMLRINKKMALFNDVIFMVHRMGLVCLMTIGVNYPLL